MKKQSLKFNFILSTAYQVLGVIMPFITAPYISRILGAGNIGIYSYTNSIETYFAMFAALGTVTYGTREIATKRDNEYERSKAFWEIELLSVITSGIISVLWIGWSLFNTEYRIYYLILTINLLSSMFNISWLFAGMEYFKGSIIPQIILKIVGVIAQLTLVKTADDLGLYMIIVALTTFLSNVTMWFMVPKFVKSVPFKDLRIAPHFRETLVYFIPSVANTLYSAADKTMIGALTHNSYENGFYEQATRIITLADAVVVRGFNMVMQSRNSYYFSLGKFDEMRDGIRKSIDFVLFIGIGMTFGIIGIADRFVPLFFGKGYDNTILILRVLSPVIVVSALSGCISGQYYTPANLRKQCTMYLIFGTIINLVLNAILIPNFLGVGAAIASVLAEMVILVLYSINARSFMNIGRAIIKQATKKIAIGTVMLGIVLIIGKVIDNALLAVIIQVIIGAGIYIVLLYLLKDSFVYHLRGNLFLKRK